MSGVEMAYRRDIEIRIVDEQLPPEGVAVIVNEFEQDGVVFDRDGIKVIAFAVDHGPAITPAYGYRIEYRGRVAVVSGDTRYNENVIRFGTGADLLIHEVAIARPELMSEPFIQRIMAHHTTPREAGLVFSRTRPRLAAFTHLVFLASDTIAPASVADLIAETRHTYSGPLEVGEDLMSFCIDEAISTHRFVPPRET